MIIYSNDKNRCYTQDDLARRQSTFTSPLETRDPFERDYGRIVHSASFRRLQAKTQVIGSEAGDLHRTRLTHSMEAAQIARSIVIFLNTNDPKLGNDYSLDVSLLEAAALAHDLGHPPFGHHGEQALHDCMYSYGGFEGNAQTFRILSRIEGDKVVGLNLTRALLYSIVKYPIILDDAIGTNSDKSIPPKANIYKSDEEAFNWMMDPLSQDEKKYYMGWKPTAEGFQKTIRKAWECSLLELADDIAYVTHDVEDAINLGFIHSSKLLEVLSSFPEFQKHFLRTDHFKYDLKQLISALISYFVFGVELKENNITTESPRLKYKVVLMSERFELLTLLKKLVIDEVVYSQTVQTMAWKGRFVIKQLFEAMMNEPNLLPVNDRSTIRAGISTTDKARVVCDYIAGMTDSYAMKVYQQLFGRGDSASFIPHF
ncbi:anti-phage deoxyguanosine triphosphatase [Shimazuella kribbensis]|uniref:anti-phage deoxyguanosine triphosphatase n=1 Tax=Shimazuella kribbensis TaxID=139808 RepID=UPI0004169694|nr:anti-phage deoxyguanosine triphosphatase [Shimazuella kribbensis]